MENYHKFTQEQRESAAKSLELRRDHPWMAEAFLSEDDADNGRELLFPIAIDLQCELNEARELLEGMYHQLGHLIISTAWQERRREWLSRNK